MPTYTVLTINNALGTTHFCGKFDTIEEAADYARTQAERSRSFAEFVVYLGTPKNWDQATDRRFKGTK